MPIVKSLPSDFVYALRGGTAVQTKAGGIPITCYLCGGNGTNQKIKAMYDALEQKGIQDKETNQTLHEFVTNKFLSKFAKDTEYWCVWKGQGHPKAFALVMDFLCTNKEQLKGPSDVDPKNWRAPDKVLNEVYTFFKGGDDQSALKQMASMGGYFGLDCIGFVANYLREVNLWNYYKGVSNNQWQAQGGFANGVNELDKVRPLNLVVWPTLPTKHCALVDEVKGIGPNGLNVIVCHSSAGGPQCNSAVLTLASGEEDHKDRKEAEEHAAAAEEALKQAKENAATLTDAAKEAKERADADVKAKEKAALVAKQALAKATDAANNNSYWWGPNKLFMIKGGGEPTKGPFSDSGLPVTGPCVVLEWPDLSCLKDK